MRIPTFVEIVLCAILIPVVCVILPFLLIRSLTERPRRRRVDQKKMTMEQCGHCSNWRWEGGEWYRTPLSKKPVLKFNVKEGSCPQHEHEDGKGTE